MQNSFVEKQQKEKKQYFKFDINKLQDPNIAVESKMALSMVECPGLTETSYYYNMWAF